MIIFWIWLIGVLCILGIGAAISGALNENIGVDQLTNEVFGLFVLLALLWPILVPLIIVWRIKENKIE